MSAAKYVRRIVKDGQVVEFTANEVNIIELIAAGKTGEGLARSAFLCKSSTETTARRAAMKLGALSRAHLVYLAMKEGVIT